MTPPDRPPVDPMTLDYVLDRLADCRDAIARLAVADNGRDVDALIVMDAASRTLAAHGRGDD